MKQFLLDRGAVDSISNYLDRLNKTERSPKKQIIEFFEAS